MLDIIFLITCSLLAYVGIKFVLWVIRRSLPVPLGEFMWLRFFFWWTASTGAAVVVYFGAITVIGVLVLEIWGLSQRLEPSLLLMGGLILSAPYWVGLVKGIDLQVTHRWSV
ncbi:MULTISPECIES: hypothetical protein [unclassified Ruegeria]|uniref:hypothetical protein n=1 Tax=unclassified Ruegeria TaxID=2625375 RepID=UPI001488668C|nr:MULTISPECIES: hypothetical protein [unclassified Ruegeria]NOD65494.1 hypothetical protein [Ruegeria sp. HKCCD6109]